MKPLVVPKLPSQSGFTTGGLTPSALSGFENFGQKHSLGSKNPLNPLKKPTNPADELKKRIDQNLKNFASGEFTPDDFRKVTEDTNAAQFPEFAQGYEKLKEDENFLIRFNDLAREDIGPNGFIQLLNCLTYYIPKRWDPTSEICQEFKSIFLQFLDFAIAPDENGRVNEQIINKTNQAWAQISVIEFPEWDIFAELVEDQKKDIYHFINILKIFKEFAILIDSTDKNAIIDFRRESDIRSNLKNNSQRAEYICNVIRDAVYVDLNPDDESTIQLFKAGVEAFQYLLQFIDFQQFFFAQEESGENILDILLAKTSQNEDLYQLAVQFFGEVLNSGYMDIYDIDEYNTKQYILSISAKLHECSKNIIPSVLEDENRTAIFFREHIWAENLVISIVPAFFEEFSDVLETQYNQECIDYFLNLIFYIVEKEPTNTEKFSQIMDYFQRCLQRIRASFNKRENHVYLVYSKHVSHMIYILITNMVEPITIQKEENDQGEEEIFAQNETKYGDLFSTMKQALCYAIGFNTQEFRRVIVDNILVPLTTSEERPEEDAQIDMIKKLCWSVGAVFPALNEMNDKDFVLDVRNLIEDFTNYHQEHKSFPEIVMAYSFFLSQGYKFYLRENDAFIFAFLHLIDFMQIPDDEIKPVSIEAFTLLAKNSKESLKQKNEDGVPILLQLYEHIADVLIIGEDENGFPIFVPLSTQKIFITLLSEQSKLFENEEFRDPAINFIYDFIIGKINGFDQSDVGSDDDLVKLIHALGVYDSAVALADYYERTVDQLDPTIEKYNQVCSAMVECFENPEASTHFSHLENAQVALIHHIITLVDGSKPDSCMEVLMPRIVEAIFTSFNELPLPCKSTSVLRLAQQCIKKIKNVFFSEERIGNPFFENVYGHICQLLEENFEMTKRFMELLYSVTVEMFKQSNTVFESIPQFISNHIIEAIKNGYKEYDQKISNLAFDSLYEMIKGCKKCTTEFKEGFFGYFNLDFFMDTISTLTDGIHTFALPKVAAIISELKSAPTFNEQKVQIYEAFSGYFQDSIPEDQLESIYSYIIDCSKEQQQVISDQLRILLVASHRVTKFDKDLRRMKIEEYRKQLESDIEKYSKPSTSGTKGPLDGIKIDDNSHQQGQEGEGQESQQEMPPQVDPDANVSKDEYPDVTDKIDMGDNDDNIPPDNYFY